MGPRPVSEEDGDGSDHAAWRPAYDAHEPIRTGAGITNSRVYRKADDPNGLVILFHIADVARARVDGGRRPEDRNGEGRRAQCAGDTLHRLIAVPSAEVSVLVGTITMWKPTVEPFFGKQIALMQTFADQGLIKNAKCRQKRNCYTRLISRPGLRVRQDGDLSLGIVQAQSDRWSSRPNYFFRNLTRSAVPQK